jgi:hypothetical protein
MNMTSTIISAAGGSLTPYCKYMDVLPGQTYYLYIDNWVISKQYNSSVFFNVGRNSNIGIAVYRSYDSAPSIYPPGIPAANPADPREIICANRFFDFSTLSAGIQRESEFCVSLSCESE